MDENTEKAEKKIPSRGIPSRYAFYLPPHYSKEIKRFEENELPTRNLLSLKEIVNFIFPEKYQEKYHNIALLFLEELSKKLVMDSEDISLFRKQHKLSKATLYNRVIKRLKELGLVKKELLATQQGKRRKMKLTLSKTFGNYLLKIADSWLAFVDEARAKNKR